MARKKPQTCLYPSVRTSGGIPSERTWAALLSAEEELLLYCAYGAQPTSVAYHGSPAIRVDSGPWLEACTRLGLYCAGRECWSGESQRKPQHSVCGKRTLCILGLGVLGVNASATTRAIVY